MRLAAPFAAGRIRPVSALARGLGVAKPDGRRNDGGESPLAAETGRGQVTGYLTTHVLDTARGVPAEGIAVELYRIEGETRTHLRTLRTNSDGRTDGPILAKSDFEPGVYELVFHAGAYLEIHSPPSAHPHFLDQVPIRFGISEASHYHVPLLLSPYGYSTYRGS